MPDRFTKVLKSLSAPPRADFFLAAVQSGEFTTNDLLELFGEKSVEATLHLALEYIDAKSILVLASKRSVYEQMLAEISSAKAQRTMDLIFPSRRRC